METTLKEIANPAAVAVEWTSHYDGFRSIRHQLVWPRGTWTMHYGTEREDGTWSLVRVDSPERFGIDGTLKGARKAFSAFLAK